jgi:hypothetical protein
MAETNFYSYMFAQAAEAAAFDALVEVVDLSSPESIQRAFAAYLSDNMPPINFNDALLEESFRKTESDNSGHSIVYEVSIPGIEDAIDKDEVSTYFENFLDRIGAENNSESGYKVEVSISPDERGGEDLEIFMELTGKQTRTGKKEE